MSCYTFKPNDAIESLFVYSEANFESNQLTPIDRFQELQVTESGWRKFPSVYETNGTNWLRVKEGWIHSLLPTKRSYSSTLEAKTNLANRSMISILSNIDVGMPFIPIELVGEIEP